MSTPAVPGVNRNLTDAEEFKRSEAQAPFPFPLQVVEKPRIFGAFTAVLPVGATATYHSDVTVPELFWLIAIPNRNDFAQVAAWPSVSVDETPVFVYPGASVKIPQRGSALTVRNDSAIAGLVVQIFAVANVEFDYNPPKLV